MTLTLRWDICEVEENSERIPLRTYSSKVTGHEHRTKDSIVDKKKNDRTKNIHSSQEKKKKTQKNLAKKNHEF